MYFPPESQQKRLSKAQFLHLAKEAEVEANKRRWSAISERYLHPNKQLTAGFTEPILYESILHCCNMAAADQRLVFGSAADRQVRLQIISAQGMVEPEGAGERVRPSFHQERRLNSCSIDEEIF